jgi:hypothetical protein
MGRCTSVARGRAALGQVAGNADKTDQAMGAGIAIAFAECALVCAITIVGVANLGPCGAFHQLLLRRSYDLDVVGLRCVSARTQEHCHANRQPRAPVHERRCS